MAKVNKQRNIFDISKKLAYAGLLLLSGACATIPTTSLPSPELRPPESGCLPWQEKELPAKSSRYLSRSELKAYLQGKKVALFGECHGACRDDLLFMTLIPDLKKLGYTHVALEKNYQEEETQKKAYELQEIIKEFKEKRSAINGIAAVALYEGLEVICIDDNDTKRELSRDEYMEQRITKVIRQGGKVAYFVGLGHLLLVDMDHELASHELMAREYVDTAIVQKIAAEGAKPLGKRLVERYGTQQVALVNLNSCSTGRTIPTCFLE